MALEALADQIEKLARQILPTPVELLNRREINLVKIAEHRVGDFRIDQRADLDALLLKRGPLVTHRVAALALELIEIIVEGREAGVDPMILIAEPLHETEFLELRGLVLGAKIYVN